VGEASNRGGRAALAGISLGLIALASRYAPATPIDALLRPRRPAARVALHLRVPRLPSDAAAPTSSAPATPDRFATAEARAACPADMTLVDGEFCPEIELRCVRPGYGHGCAEYERGVACAGKLDHRRYCVDRYEWPNEVGENPRVFVDWFEAKALCAGAHKRLCRRTEWMLACEGPKRMPYPYGYVRQPSPCNLDRAALGFDVNAMMKDVTREGELARLWQADKIGAHPDCVSAYGAYDMAGNVDEWTDEGADDPSTDNPAALHGGYWGPVRDTCRLATTSHGPTFRFYQVGFRCCGDTIDGVETPPPRPWVDTHHGKGRELH
jgi:hypothetical protein